MEHCFVLRLVETVLNLRSSGIGAFAAQERFHHEQSSLVETRLSRGDRAGVTVGLVEDGLDCFEVGWGDRAAEAEFGGHVFHFLVGAGVKALKQQRPLYDC